MSQKVWLKKSFHRSFFPSSWLKKKYLLFLLLLWLGSSSPDPCFFVAERNPLYYLYENVSFDREAPGQVIEDFGHGFKSKCQQKTRWKDGSLKIENNKRAAPQLCFNVTFEHEKALVCLAPYLYLCTIARVLKITLL